VRLQREQLSKAFSALVFHIQLLPLSVDCFTQRGTDVTYQGTADPNSDIPVINSDEPTSLC
jgi:hypothetical protein